MIVVVREYDVLDAVPAQRQQHARGLRHQRRINENGQRREQHPQPLDFLAPRFARQQRVHDGQLDGARADEIQRLFPTAGADELEPPFRSAAQAMELKIGDRG